jgi:hypothetical protein
MDWKLSFWIETTISFVFSTPKRLETRQYRWYVSLNPFLFKKTTKTKKQKPSHVSPYEMGQASWCGLSSSAMSSLFFFNHCFLFFKITSFYMFFFRIFFIYIYIYINTHSLFYFVYKATFKWWLFFSYFACI